MRLSSEAQAWLNAKVQAIMTGHHLSEPERAGTHYELMSHLHAAGENKAREAGRDEVSVGDLQAALLDMGGEAGVAQAFVVPKARPLRRAGVIVRTAAIVVDGIIISVGFWATAFFFSLATAIFLSPFGGGDRFDPFPFDGPSRLWPFGFFGLFALVAFAYFTYLEGSRGITFGKKVFNLQVQRVDGQPMTYREAAIRNAVKMFPPILLLDALFLLVFFNNEKQRVSDRLAETIVVEVG